MAHQGAVEGADNVLVVDHPIVAHRVTSLRDASTGSDAFRELVSEISAWVAYEALRDLATDEVVVDTPVTTGAVGRRVRESVLVVPVLRAGLGMVPAIQRVLPMTEVAHVGLRRDEETLASSVYLDRLPRDLSGRRVIVCDPMLATGGSLITVCDLIVDRGATDILVLCLIASAPGLARFHAAHPGILVACAGADAELDERGYIVPGLGDAGDRLFGPPL